MKAKLSGKIRSIEMVDGDTEISVDLTGKVDTTNIAAQKATMFSTLTIKSMVADQMKIGAVITITVSDEEENNGLT